MEYPHGTPGRRLFLYLLNCGGSATRAEISRRQANGRLLTEARVELDGLISEETCRSAATRRPVKRVLLTMKGWGAAAHFQRGWEPRRLSTDKLKEWLYDLQQEADPWACQFLKDADDAFLWHQHQRQVRSKAWRCEPRKPKTKRLPNAGSFKPGQAPRPISTRSGTTDTLLEPTYQIPGASQPEMPAPAPRLAPRLRAGLFCERCHFDAELCQCPIPVAGKMPTGHAIRTRPVIAEDPIGDPTDRIREKARRLGYAGAIRANGILYDSRLIPFSEWDAKVPD